MRYPSLYPPVVPPAHYPPTWEDLERLSRDQPQVRQGLALHHRGDFTREQMLIAIVFTLADAHQKLFAEAVRRRLLELPALVVVPGQLDPGGTT